MPHLAAVCFQSLNTALTMESGNHILAEQGLHFDSGIGVDSFTMTAESATKICTSPETIHHCFFSYHTSVCLDQWHYLLW